MADKKCGAKSKGEVTHSMAHYLVSLHRLTEEGKRSRAIDLAEYLGLARSSITLGVRRLKQHGLVLEDDDHNLRLTADAHAKVHEVLSNRTLLEYFFKVVLGVSDSVAASDACKIESLLSLETQEKLFKFLKEILVCRDGSAAKTVADCLCSFKNVDDFREAQQGDSTLNVAGCFEGKK